MPLAPGFLLVDLLAQLQLATVVVSRNYLGSINHTLLTLEALQRRGLPIRGLVFNGEVTPATEEFILEHSGVPVMPRLRPEAVTDAAMVSRYAAEFRAWGLTPVPWGLTPGPSPKGEGSLTLVFLRRTFRFRFRHGYRIVILQQSPL
nr:AAA family ATPase [Hymenobacter qilianensis]